jgi:hypothetical protein
MKNLLGKEFVKLCNEVPLEECTVQYRRLDTLSAMTDKYLSRLFGTGALWITQDPSRPPAISAGDVVVPSRKASSKAKEINDTPHCMVTEVHLYDGSDPKRPNLNIAHIHFTCKPAPSPKDAAKLVSE